jgi:hypothetical protein
MYTNIGNQVGEEGVRAVSVALKVKLIQVSSFVFQRICDSCILASISLFDISQVQSLANKGTCIIFGCCICKSNV